MTPANAPVGFSSQFKNEKTDFLTAAATKVAQPEKPKQEAAAANPFAKKASTEASQSGVMKENDVFADLKAGVKSEDTSHSLLQKRPNVSHQNKCIRPMGSA